MKSLLKQLYDHHSLSQAEAYQALVEIAKGEIHPAQISSFLTVFNMRGISLDELAGFRNALLELCRPVDLSDFETVDLCGTGGDGKDTFNISTLAAFVTAGAGVKVAKHGNYGSSSICGSSNVLEHLGIKFTGDQEKLKKQVDLAGICVLHAPLFHPAMKAVAPVRKGLGLKTFFNMLGPLVNPSQPQNQFVGVFNLDLARKYQYLFQQKKHNFSIVHSLEGYDEVSLTGDFKLITNSIETISNPATLDFSPVKASEISGGKSIADAAKIFTAVLQGKASPAQRAVVLANASLAIQTAKGGDFNTAKALAEESLDSGKALKTFETLITLN